MDLISVQKFFQHGMFNIPNYQRGYAWQKQQVEEFLEDLKEATEGVVKEHYTGTVTVIAKGNKSIFPKTFDLFDVVDGQQRLTTFTIFVYAIHNRLKSLKVDSDTLSDILKNIIYKNEPVLNLNNDTNDFYREYIINKTISELPDEFENKSQQNLANAKRQISKFLDGYKNLEEIQNFYQCLMSKFVVNFYSLSDESDVGVVFETMNNRGLPLTQIDKVKNYLIYLASRKNDDKLSQYINANFGLIFKELMKIDASVTQENEVLRYSYIIYKGINEPDIHSQIKNDLLEKKKYTEKGIVDYVDFLVKTANIYSKLRRAEIKNEKVRVLVRRIIWLGNPSNFLPLLISLFSRYQEEELIEVLEAMEIFSFRVYKIGNRQGKAVQNRLHRFAYAIYNNKSSKDDVLHELTYNIYANDQDFKLSLQSANFFNSQNWDEIAYFLYEYERNLHAQRKSDFPLLTFDGFTKEASTQKFQIEHIEPQTPLNREPSSSLHKLGNLVLTFDNAKLSNKEFHDKKAIYKNSKLVIENELIVHSKWEDQQINIRTKELVEFAMQRWKLKIK